MLVKIQNKIPAPVILRELKKLSIPLKKITFSGGQAILEVGSNTLNTFLAVCKLNSKIGVEIFDPILGEFYKVEGV